MRATDTNTFTTKRKARGREACVLASFTWLLSVCCCCCCCCLLAFGTNCSKNVFYNLPGNWKRSPLALLAPFLSRSLWFLFLFAVCWFAFIVAHTHTHTRTIAHIAFHLASKRGGAAFCGLDWALKIYALPHKEATEIEAKSWRAQRGRQQKEKERGRERARQRVRHEIESSKRNIKNTLGRKRKSRHEANKNTIANGASG